MQERLHEILQIGLASPWQILYNVGHERQRRRLRIDVVKKKYNGKEYTSVLLRSSYRKDGRIKHETLGNLTDLPPDVIDFIRL